MLVSAIAGAILYRKLWHGFASAAAYCAAIIPPSEIDVRDVDNIAPLPNPTESSS